MRHAPRAADINVTPLIDILLVLLVIFLATLPLEQPSLDAATPAPAPHRDVPPSTSKIVLEYTGDGRIAINSEPVTVDRLDDRLRQIYRQRRDKVLFIMGDPSLPYKRIIEVMDVAKGAGVTSIGIVTPAMRAGGA